MTTAAAMAPPAPAARTGRRGALARLWAYLREMHPPARRLAAAVLQYVSFTVLLLRLHDRPLSSLASPWTLLGVWAVFALMLTLRLMDELKDADIDRRLFASRPLPSGRVLESDVRGALAVVAALLVAAHLPAGLGVPAAVLLGYAVLMFRWFFVPALMRPRLLLTLVSHQPIMPLLLLHLVAMFAVQHGMGLRDLRAPAVALALVVPWSGVLAWELSRKIRAAEDEDDYVTYSRRLGRRTAVLLAASVQAAGVAAGVALVVVSGLSWRLPLVLAVGFAAALVGHVRFLVRPDRETSRLRPFAEANAFTGWVGGLLA